MNSSDKEAIHGLIVKFNDLQESCFGGRQGHFSKVGVCINLQIKINQELNGNSTKEVSSH